MQGRDVPRGRPDRSADVPLCFGLAGRSDELTGAGPAGGTESAAGRHPFRRAGGSDQGAGPRGRGRRRLRITLAIRDRGALAFSDGEREHLLELHAARQDARQHHARRACISSVTTAASRRSIRPSIRCSFTAWWTRPKKFSMADIKRFPSVTRKHFIECSGNGLTEWNKPTLKTVQGTHGLLEHVRMDRRAVRDDRARNWPQGRCGLGAGRRRRCGRDDAQHPDGEDAEGRAHRLRTERRGLAARAGLPAAVCCCPATKATRTSNGCGA